MNKGEAIIIDGNAIIWRSWHATQRTSEEEVDPEKAINAIKRAIKSYLKKNYEYGIVVFDSTKNTFRKQLFPEYKANRTDPMPEELFKAMGEIKKTIRELGLIVLPAPKLYEGDDAIATLTKIFAKSKIRSDVFSTDKDMLQIVSYYTSVTLLKRNSIKEEYTFKNFQQKNEGLMPYQIPIFKAMVGDSSDNYKGIAGIGPKMAYKLLQSCPDTESIYKNIDNLDFIGPKQRQELLQNREKLEWIIKNLSTTRDDIEEIDTDINKYKMNSNESDSGSGKSGG